ncbi:TraB/GumN family protein [Chryseobacterium sp. CBSDS_008]|uniref:TraB/GumN family protein n=1 Tax=Chryseobacterium sp. CBSDS_008 TaxID=3415265 RepID=UPI003CF0A494
MNSRFVLLVILFFNIQYMYAQKTILWKVEKEGTGKISYLLGTMHQVGNSFIDERSKIKELLLQSKIAVFESVEDKKTTIIDVMNKRTDDFSYRDNLDKKDVQFLESAASDWTVPVRKLSPAELAVKLEQLYVLDVCETAKQTDTWKHLDDYLLSLAKIGGIKTEGLETNSDQFNAINSERDLNWKNAKEAVSARIENLREKKNRNQLCRISKTYLGDMNFDYQFGIKCAGNDAMVINRNKTWLPKLGTILESDNAFIAVGLVHLFGDCGIISELRKQGYSVTPVPLSKDKA